jgi:hypothetical protein
VVRWLAGFCSRPGISSVDTMDTTREHRTFTSFRMKGGRLRGPVTAGLVVTIAAAAMAAPAVAVALTASPASAAPVSVAEYGPQCV